jgi:hypothetical protein
MSMKLYIFGEEGLWCSRSPGASRFDLERALDDFLQYRGEVIWDGDEHRGPRWNVDVLLHEDAEDVDDWIQRLTAFFRQWGVQDRRLAFTIIREGAPKWEHRRVEIRNE